MSSLRESVVVSYGFHSDGSQLRGNNKQFHPVYVFLTCLPPSHFRQHDNYECVGMIPVLTWQQLGLPENMAANELKRARQLKLSLRNKAIDIILSPFKALMKRGMEGTVNDELVLMIPTPTHWVRDLKEGVELMGMIENFKSNCSCLFFTTATPEEFADVLFRFPPRTESKMEKIKRKCRSYETQGRKDDARSLLRKYGLTSDRQNALSGWGGGVDYAVMFSYPDRLHQ
eukprot:jgi/Botrbrau1/18832/Bobra.0662s0002.1